MADASPSPATPDPQQLTVTEVIKILESSAGTIRIHMLKPVRTLYEIVEHQEDHGKQLNTSQNVVLMEGNRMLVQTTLQQHIPLRPNADSPPDASAFIFYALSIIYEFPETVTDETERFVRAKIMGVQMTWPFWRAHVYSTMANAGAMGMHIAPVLGLPAFAQMAGFKSDENHPPA